MLIYTATTAYLCLCGFFIGMSGVFNTERLQKKPFLTLMYLLLAFAAGGYGLAWAWDYRPFIFLAPALIAAWQTGRLGRKVANRFTPMWLALAGWMALPAIFHTCPQCHGL